MKIKCKIKKIKPLEIYHFNFEDQYDMCMTFIRPQEYYESPKFKGKYFTLEEYMDWYVKESGWGNPDCHFDYTAATSGFNIPGDNLCEFYKEYQESHRGLENELRPREEWLFEQLEKQGIDLCDPTPFYIIATYGEEEALDHEIRHGMFHLLPEYRKEVQQAIRKYGLKRLRKYLIDKGYHKSVVEDEIHAYALTGWIRGATVTKEMENLRKDLKIIKKKYL